MGKQQKVIKQITSLDHQAVKHLFKMRHNRDYRYEHHAVVIEGVKPIQDVGSIFPLKTLVVLDETFIPKGISAEEILVVTPAIMNKLTVMESPEGILAELAMPAKKNLEEKDRLLILDGISDPGNLGAILRTALALGWEGVYLLDHCCDPFNDKALRAARGATFHLSLDGGDWNKISNILKKGGYVSYIADLHGDNPEKLPKHNKIALILGNEAHGPSKDSLTIGKPVTIPMKREMESLNVAVAAGILMYHLRGKKE